MLIEDRKIKRMCADCAQKVASGMIHPEFIKDIHDQCKESAIGYWTRIQAINLKLLF